MFNDNIIHKGFLTLVVREGLDHNKNLVSREIIKMDDAVAGLITHDNKILLVKQPRFAKANSKENSNNQYNKIMPDWKDPYNEYVWEIPAGMLDLKNENPFACLLRETEEEAGIKLDDDQYTSELMYTYFPSLGHCDHKLSLYRILIDDYVSISKQETNDNDVCESGWFTCDQIGIMIRDGQIVDGKTIISYLWFQNNY